MAFNEIYGEVSNALLKALKKNRVPQASFDILRYHFGPDDGAIVDYLNEWGESGPVLNPHAY